jgi:hypothetical protein
MHEAYGESRGGSGRSSVARMPAPDYWIVPLIMAGWALIVSSFGHAILKTAKRQKKAQEAGLSEA